jgi:uncharacterized iron-regulated membrane protein
VSSNAPRTRSWPDYRAVWRWHFYAGLFCIPFVLLLSATGAAYLFKDEVEAWIDRPFDTLTLSQRAPAAEQVRAALKAFPGSTFQSYELPRSPNAAARILLKDGGETRRVYLHPESLEVLSSTPERERLMRILFRLHGELLLGDRGSNIVELAASWTLVMLLTGLFLWWPRNVKGLGGVVYPRLAKGGRIFWRDLHGVTGFWTVGFAVFLIASGLPWAKFWGDYFKTIRYLTGTAVVRSDWANTSKAKTNEGEHSGHESTGPRRARGPIPAADLAQIDRVVTGLLPLHLPHPVVVAPGNKPGDWSAKSMTGNRPQRVNLVVDGKTGEVLQREGFQEKHWLDKVVSVGIAAHEGRLFGWANQMLGVMTCMGLIGLSLSGLWMWWRRRDTGGLGAPRPGIAPRWSWSLLAVIAFLAVCVPLFGITVFATWGLERFVLRHVPGVNTWLVLRVPDRAATEVSA